MIIGITGRAGVGKSYLATILKEHYPQIIVIELDIIGHQLLKDSNNISKLAQIFGQQILNNNEIDRGILGQIVFKSKDMKEKLNTIMHPQIFDHTQTLIQSNKQATILIVGALIKEIGLSSLCTKKITIDAKNKQIEYHAQSLERIAMIHQSQRTVNAYKEESDYIFTNTFDSNTKENWIVFWNQHIQTH